MTSTHKFLAQSKAVFTCAVLALSVAGCGETRTEGEPIGSGQPLAGPATAGLPDGVFSVMISRGSGYENPCFASHLSADVLLLASHCFVHIGAPHDGAPGATDGVKITVDDGVAPIALYDPRVFFYVGKDGSATPGAPQTEWTKNFETYDLDCTHDLALIVAHDPQLAAKKTVPLWTPTCPAGSATSPCKTGLAGAPVEFGGSSFGYVTGSNVLLGLMPGSILKSKDCINSNSNNLVFLIEQGSQAIPEKGDSGTGLITEATSGSVVYGTSACEAFTPAAAGQKAVIGVLTGGGSVTGAYFVPTIFPQHAEWITQTALKGGDWDGDGVCNQDDNCWNVKNSDQRNSNPIAEQGWGTLEGPLGLGDKCDPAPTPVPRLVGVRRPSEGLVRQRIIRDRVRIEPVLGPDGPVADFVAPRFCMCRGTDGTPKTKLDECKAPPFHCIPNSGYFTWPEGKSIQALPPGQTTWHRMDVSPFPFCALPTGCVGLQFPVSYPGAEFQAGYWHYAEDNARWIQSGFFGAVPPAPGYPLGTDLAGVLWAHGLATVGATKHFIPNTGLCFPETLCPANMTDGYVVGVAPDRKNHVNIVAKLPLKIGPGDFGYDPGSDQAQSPHFAGEHELDPLPLVSIDPITLESAVWLADGARFTADDVLSPTVRAALADDNLRWVPASEPITMVRRSAVARAVAVSNEGTAIIKSLFDSVSGFTIGRGIRDDLTLAQLESNGPAARTGFGAAYSRLANATFIVGGRMADGDAAHDVWIGHDGTWSSTLLSTSRPPANVEAVTYAWGDARLWLVDREPTGPWSRRFLYRVSPWTGEVETLRELHFLKQFDHVWLRTVEDGRVLLAATNTNVHFVALIESAPAANGKVSVAGFDFGAGELLKSPEIRYGRITRALLRKLAGEPEIIVEHLGTIGTLKGGPSGLGADL